MKLQPETQRKLTLGIKCVLSNYHILKANYANNCYTYVI